MDAGMMDIGTSTTACEALSDEDRGRTRFYALIGRLFFAAPDAALLQELCRSGDGEAVVGGDKADNPGELARAWQALQTLCRNAEPQVIQQEYDALFIGAGKVQVTPYTSGYVGHIAPDRHLVQLRQQLAAWGLGRRDAVFDGEDHISGLCDVMRFLIEQNQELTHQKQFFEEFVQAGALPFCDAVIAAPNAAFYRQVALFAKAFFEVEKAAFDMLMAE